MAILSSVTVLFGAGMASRGTMGAIRLIGVLERRGVLKGVLLSDASPLSFLRVFLSGLQGADKDVCECRYECRCRNSDDPCPYDITGNSPAYRA